MRERNIERRLVMETLKRGGVALKFVSPGCAGVPDRIVMMPKGPAPEAASAAGAAHPSDAGDGI